MLFLIFSNSSQYFVTHFFLKKKKNIDGRRNYGAHSIFLKPPSNSAAFPLWHFTHYKMLIYQSGEKEKKKNESEQNKKKS